MKLSINEEFISDYKFNESGSQTNQIVLTDKRLVIIYGNSEESFPLSKITAVKVAYKQWKILLYIGLVFFVLLGVLMGSGRMLGGMEILIVSIVPIIMIIVGLRKSTLFSINHMGGEKTYKVKKYDDKLDQFIEKVNESMF
jgi:hypothetical protein